MLDFVRANLPVLVLLAGLAIGSYVIYTKGIQVAEQRADMEKLEKANAALQAGLQRLRDEASRVQSIDTSRVKSAESIRTTTKETIREVPRYLPAVPPSQPSDPITFGAGHVLLPAGFWLLHNAAAQGTPVDDYATSSGPDATPVTPQAVAETVIENYGTCHDTADRLTHLQDYVSSVIESASSPSVDAASSPSGSDW